MEDVFLNTALAKLSEIDKRGLRQVAININTEHIRDVVYILDKLSKTDRDVHKFCSLLLTFLDTLLKLPNDVDIFEVGRIEKKFYYPITDYIMQKHGYYTKGQVIVPLSLGILVDIIIFIFTDIYSKIYYIPIFTIYSLFFDFFRARYKKKKGLIFRN